ncbi:P-loop NTPase [Haloplanus ruber]|uniref:P-loop NTPase n=1 Tax=Haloplanus ruber TaxID=869892 RepID=A0ABD6CTT7_9EURY|nr:P-loop NTPase [Haloplanus ruber]
MTRVYAVASGKGGVGKTTTVANLGAVLAEAGHEAVVVDVDLGMGNLAGVLGIDAGAGETLNDALAGTAEVSETVREGPAGLSVLPASDALDDFGKADPTGLPAVLDALDADVVLLDTSAGLSHDSVEPLRVADEVVLVSTAERGAIGDTAKTSEVADRVGTPVMGVVVTRTTAETDAESVGERLGVELLESIPDDPAVAAAAADGTPLVTAAPAAPATAAYRRLAAALTGDDSITATADEPASTTGPAAVADAEAVAEGDEALDGGTEADDESAEGIDTGSEEGDDANERTGFLRWLLG